jgi:hypothetical protein
VKLSTIRERVKQFLKESLDSKDLGENVRVVGIESADDGWVVEADVIERNLALPGHRVFEKKRYIVKLTENLDVTAYRQINEAENRET